MLELTPEQNAISQRNRKKAVKLLNIGKGYCLHHRDTELRHKDIERYIQWNIEDLEVMTNIEHTKFHWAIDGNERRTKIGAANSKKVYCVETDTWYTSSVDASKKTGIGRSAISNCLIGLSKTAGGYHFNYYGKD